MALAAGLALAQFLGVLRVSVHSGGVLVIFLGVLTFYLATGIVVALLALGLYRLGSNPLLRARNLTVPFFSWAAATAATVALAVALGGFR